MSASNSRTRNLHVVFTKAESLHFLGDHGSDETSLRRTITDVAARLRFANGISDSAIIIIDHQANQGKNASRTQAVGLFAGEEDAVIFEVNIGSDDVCLDENEFKDLLKRGFRVSACARREEGFRTLVARALADILVNDESRRERFYAKLVHDERALNITYEGSNWREIRPVSSSPFQSIVKDYIRAVTHNSSESGIQSRSYGPPGRQIIEELCDTTLNLLLRDCYGADWENISRPDFLTEVLQSFKQLLGRSIQQSLVAVDCESCPVQALDLANEIALNIVRKIPRLATVIGMDALAGYNNDPSVNSASEFAMISPGIRAIAIYRMAHELEKAGVPILPRLMTEVAHSRYGIDIHPGARIECGFVVDHGTATVIGQTAVIGKNCVLYQGVTLGAINFPRNDDGQLVNRGGAVQRHPTLEDYVTVYSNASILGGETVVGRNSMIGANVRLTQSVPPESLVTIQLTPPKIESMDPRSVLKPVRLRS